jgi:spore germination cell wall hydrolase CwlJ-like protein
MLRAIVLLIAAMAILIPALIVHFAPPVVRHLVAHPLPTRVVPQAEVPPVEPVAFEDLDPDEARAFNASVPFVEGPNPAARPFRLPGDAPQQARAIDCMAAAVLYEAGDDPVGQRAVAQVVINRVRHPAFPKTICGVVFQGSERPTGCQFTFTCDGALVRHHWADAQWARARSVAMAALNGAVFRPVGHATHYHTNWVVPYWQSSLDKIAAVNTHLFFRWTGWWGTPPAFNRHVSADEPIIAALAAYSEAHRGIDTVVAPEGGVAVDAAAAPLPRSLPGDANSFLLTLDPATLSPDGFAQLAARACADRPYCKVMGWTDPTKTPTALPLQPAQIAAMSFSYLRDQAHGYDKALWNCREFRRSLPAQCMKAQTFLTAVAVVPENEAPAAVAAGAQTAAARSSVPALPDGLAGVRRKVETPAAKSSPPTKTPPPVATGGSEAR